MYRSTYIILCTVFICMYECVCVCVLCRCKLLQYINRIKLAENCEVRKRVVHRKQEAFCWFVFVFSHIGLGDMPTCSIVRKYGK